MRSETRLPTGVLADHLEQSRRGSVDDDLRRNYDEDVVVLSVNGARRGHDAIRELNERLQRELPDATYSYPVVLVEGPYGFLRWEAESAEAHVRDGADSYVILDGKIVAQTIHYTVEEVRSRE